MNFNTIPIIKNKNILINNGNTKILSKKYILENSKILTKNDKTNIADETIQNKLNHEKFVQNGNGEIYNINLKTAIYELSKYIKNNLN